jgi:membrane protein YdbS with pleckstrin-like domain
MEPPKHVDPARIRTIRRPATALLPVYVLRTLCVTFFTGFTLFPPVIVPLLLRYYTLRYRFEEDAVVINWGLLFRRETIIPYGRIQDIHLTRTFLERWFGIGTVEIQTASSTRGAAESIVGLEEDELVRDFLYQRMRGNEPVAPPASDQGAPVLADDPRTLLLAIRDELRAARAAVEAR